MVLGFPHWKTLPNMINDELLFIYSRNMLGKTWKNPEPIQNVWKRQNDTNSSQWIPQRLHLCSTLAVVDVTEGAPQLWFEFIQLLMYPLWIIVLCIWHYLSSITTSIHPSLVIHQLHYPSGLSSLQLRHRPAHAVPNELPETSGRSEGMAISRSNPRSIRSRSIPKGKLWVFQGFPVCQFASGWQVYKNISVWFLAFVIIIPAHYHPCSQMDFYPREYARILVNSHGKCQFITCIPHPVVATHDGSPHSALPQSEETLQDILKERIAPSKSIAQVQEPSVADDYKQPWCLHGKHQCIQDSTALPRRKGRPFDRPWCLEIGMRLLHSEENQPLTLMGSWCTR